MMNRALTIFSLPAVFGALLLAAPAAAQTTECQPGDLFCAELRIGPGRAGIRIGGEPAPPPPPPVVVQPAPEPPTVIVQPVPPPPPVVVQPAPQPPTVIVQPAPPPPPPQQVYVQPAPRPVHVRPQPRRERFPYSSTGLHLHMDGLFGEDLAMGGGGAAFRIRPIPHIALDLGAGLYGGSDYNGMDRYEIPVTADVLFFFNPRHRFQFYALVGVGGSFAHAEGINFRDPDRSLTYQSRDYAHLGGEAGIGLEWRISRVFALNLDVRGFIRERVDGDARPEFREITSDGRLQSTNTSGGFRGRVGMTFYFGN